MLFLLAWPRKFFLALLVGLGVLVAYVAIARTVCLAETNEALKQMFNMENMRHPVFDFIKNAVLFYLYSS